MGSTYVVVVFVWTLCNKNCMNFFIGWEQLHNLYNNKDKAVGGWELKSEDEMQPAWKWIEWDSFGVKILVENRDCVFVFIFTSELFF